MQNSNIELVAETHYLILPVLKNALKSQIILPGGKTVFPNANTYLDVWQSRFGDRFFDMSTLIRIGTSIEIVLRDYYMQKMGYANQIQLKADTSYSLGVFQRIMPWSVGAIDLFKAIGIDLTTKSDWITIQEIMLHRHLYAHNSGILNDKYINDLLKLTGRNLLNDPLVTSTYPAQDTLYFHPLGNITAFIEATRRFSRDLT